MGKLQIFLAFLVAFAAVASANGPVVELKQGTVEGFTTQYVAKKAVNGINETKLFTIFAGP